MLTTRLGSGRRKVVSPKAGPSLAAEVKEARAGQEDGSQVGETVGASRIGKVAASLKARVGRTVPASRLSGDTQCGCI